MLRLVKTLFDNDGYHIQFNVLDTAILRDAQKHPENYRDLVVRVAGFSAFFVRLAPGVQNEIIERTEHELAVVLGSNLTGAAWPCVTPHRASYADRMLVQGKLEWPPEFLAKQLEGEIDMAALDVKFIRESLAGRWDVAIKANGKPVGNTIMDWPDAFGLCLGVEPGKFVPAEVSVDANVRQIAMAGWRSDVGRWFGHWYNDKGGYGELRSPTWRATRSSATFTRCR